MLGLLNKEHVLVQPGYFYDMPGEAYLVVSLLAAPDVFEEGASRIVNAPQYLFVSAVLGAPSKALNTSYYVCVERVLG